MYDSKNFDLGEKSQFDAELLRYDAALAQNFEVIQTNWSGNAQQYMKPHIVTGIDTGSLSQAALDIRTAHLSEYGGTVSVVLTKGAHSWASRTRYYYYAKYSGVYIGIWSSD